MTMHSCYSSPTIHDVCIVQTPGTNVSICIYILSNWRAIIILINRFIMCPGTSADLDMDLEMLDLEMIDLEMLDLDLEMLELDLE